MVDPDGNWLEVTRLAHNMGKIHDVDVARFELKWFDGRGKPGERLLKTETLEIAGRVFRKEGLGRTSPTSSWPACQACRRKAATA